MTVETEVAALTSAVNNLTATTNVKLGTLDAKVSDAQTAEANAASHETDALAAKNAAETAAASAVSVVQQDLSAISGDMPAGAVAICEINPWSTPGDHLAWMHDASKSWFSEARVTGEYLGVASSEAAAWALPGAVAGAFYWHEASRKVFELTGTSGSSEAFRFGAEHFAARWAVAFSDRVVLLDGDGVPWMVFDGDTPGTAGGPHVYAGGSRSVSSLAWAGSILLVGNDNSAGTGVGLIEINFAADAAYLTQLTKKLKHFHDISGRNSVAANQGYVIEVASSGIVDATINDIAATILPNAPADPDTGLPVPTIGVATDGGLSFVHDDGTVTSRAESEANMETVGIEFLGNSGAYAYLHEWSAGHDGRVVYVPADRLRDEAVLAYNADLYEDWETPVVNLTRASNHVNTLRMLSDRSSPNGTARVYSEEWLGGDDGITRVWRNPTNPASGMVAYQGPDFATPPMFGDVKGAFLCERGAATLAGANYLDEDFSGYADTAALQAAWVPQNGSGVALNAGAMEVTRVNETCARFNLAQTIPAGSTVTISWDVTSNITSAYAYLGFDGGSERTPQNSNYAPVGSYSHTVTLTAPRSALVVFLGGTASFTVGLDNIKIDVSTPDRSVNGKGAIINGTLTRDADGGHTGFSAAVVEQPYNPDLDFGTGPFYTHSRVRITGGANNVIVTRTAKGAGWGAVNHFALTYRMSANQIEFKTHAGQVVAAVDPADGEYHDISTVYDGTTLFIYLDGRLVGSGALALDISGVGEPVLAMGRGYYNGSLTDSVAGLKGVIIGAGAPSPAQIRVMANWKGGPVEGTIHDLSYVAETKSLWVLTSTYLYEIGPDGAERSKHVNDISATTLAAFRDGYLVS